MTINIRKSFPITIIIFLLAAAGTLRAAEVQAAVDVNRLSLNETFTFSITATNADDFPQVEIAVLEKDFRILSGPGQQSNIQWVNGKMSSSRSLTWTLSPKRAGKLEIPALKCRVGRKTLITEPLRITVGQGPKTAGSDEETAILFVTAEPDREQVFPGEQVTVTYKLYTRATLRGLEYVDRPQSVGFWVEDLYSPAQPQFRETTVAGIRYNVATMYKAAMFPTRTGRLRISPMVLRCQVEVRDGRSSRRSYFDDFFSSAFTRRTAPRVIATDTTIIEVLPFPVGRPDDFGGAVGDFKIQAGTDQTNLKVNQAITYRISVNGTGNLNLFDFPATEFPADLEVFPPTGDFEQDPFRDNISGTVTREYILIPRAEGRYVIPQVNLDYFDPRDRSWRQSTAAAIEINVAADQSLTATSGNFTKEEIALLGKDIRYFTSDRPRWRTADRSAFSGLILLIYLIAGGLFALPVALARYDHYARRGKARRRIGSALKSSLKILASSPEDPFELVPQVIYRYLKLKLSLASDNLDPLLTGELLEDEISAELIGEITDLLNACDEGRFSPNPPGAANLLKKAAVLLERLDDEL